MFGKNIKKIRNVHGMSQQEFADLFDLKRATLGAYEEGRSNPKIETAIKIANRFSINLDELLTKELTVNRLLRFNEAMTTNTSIPSVDFEGIPCVTEEYKSTFLKNTTNTLNSAILPKIKLPYVTGDDKLAFVVDDLAMSGAASGFLPKDTVITIQTTVSEMGNASGEPVVVIINGQLYFRKFYNENNTIVLKTNLQGVEALNVNEKDITGLWKIVHIFRYTMPNNDNQMEERLSQLENTIASLKYKS